ncbi:MAG: hypothetical protein IJF79_03860 [Clostridia bacterium]|nr:hypothetical protein [Clostridia bacterium]
MCRRKQAAVVIHPLNLFNKIERQRDRNTAGPFAFDRQITDHAVDLAADPQQIAAAALLLNIQPSVGPDDLQNIGMGIGNNNALAFFQQVCAGLLLAEMTQPVLYNFHADSNLSRLICCICMRLFPFLCKKKNPERSPLRAFNTDHLFQESAKQSGNDPGWFHHTDLHIISLPNQYISKDTDQCEQTTDDPEAHPYGEQCDHQDPHSNGGNICAAAVAIISASHLIASKAASIQRMRLRKAM